MKSDFEMAFSKENMKHAWKKYIREETKKDILKDAVNYEDFAYNLERNINRIIKRIKGGDYYPQPLLRMDILKPTYTLRPISIPEIEDRLVFQSIIKILVPRIDPQLSDGVRSYRLEREDKKDDEEKDEDEDLAIMILVRRMA
jgi:RNA-directed DNA polymerase